MKEYRILKIFSPELKREKRVYLYLPKSYETSNQQYRVLYMHDGHNLFDEKTSFIGDCWGILEAYEEQADIPELIIVGIEPNENERGNELIPYVFQYRDGTKQGGDADLYLEFITKTLKPYIDNRFRTFKSPKNTGIMGSSFGGVNTAYAAFKYSDYFTRFGCVSNAFHYAFFEQLKMDAKKADLSTVKKFYMDVGTKETRNESEDKIYVESNMEMYTILKDKIPDSKLRFKIVEGAIHNEKDWEKRFPDIIKFLFND